MIFGIRDPKAPEAARPLPLLYSSASDFQFRYAVGDRSSFLHNSFLLILCREDTKKSE